MGSTGAGGGWGVAVVGWRGGWTSGLIGCSGIEGEFTGGVAMGGFTGGIVMGGFTGGVAMGGVWNSPKSSPGNAQDIYMYMYMYIFLLTDNNIVTTGFLVPLPTELLRQLRWLGYTRQSNTTSLINRQPNLSCLYMYMYTHSMTHCP